MTKFDLTPHLEPLRRHARVLTRGDVEADDLLQGALLRAVERRASFREGANLRVWLMAVLHNHFIDQSRATRRRFKDETVAKRTLMVLRGRHDV